jgi:uncharacterized Zn-finger protein
MRDPKLTGYAPIPVPGVTPVERIEIDSTNHPCDGEVGVGGAGHPRIWLRVPPDSDEVTCPYCSITYVLKPGARDGGGHGH